MLRGPSEVFGGGAPPTRQFPLEKCQGGPQMAPRCPPDASQIRCWLWLGPTQKGFSVYCTELPEAYCAELVESGQHHIKLTQLLLRPIVPSEVPNAADLIQRQRNQATRNPFGVSGTRAANYLLLCCSQWLSHQPTYCTCLCIFCLAAFEPRLSVQR